MEGARDERVLQFRVALPVDVAEERVLQHGEIPGAGTERHESGM